MNEALHKALTRLAEASDPYTQGVRDLLHLMAVVDESGRPTGRVSGYLLDVLRAHLGDGQAMHVDWSDLDAPGLHGADVLRWIDGARQAAYPQATPARAAEAVEAVFKRTVDGEDAYLMEYDRYAQRFQPVGGKIDDDDLSPEAALRREFFEELRLSAVPDDSVLSLELLPFRFEEQDLSATYGLLTAYGFRFYRVVRMAVAFHLDTNTRWITRTELLDGRSADGRPVSDIYQKAFGGIDALDALPSAQITGG
ncbi:MAG: NUDIX hydrolase [Chloroflexi bacterium]|nr:NUDIX hydrolase [Chloroflexota bacterium]